MYVLLIEKRQLLPLFWLFIYYLEYGRLAAIDSKFKPFQKLLFLVRDWHYPHDAGWTSFDVFLKIICIAKARSKRFKIYSKRCLQLNLLFLFYCFFPLETCQTSRIYKYFFFFISASTCIAKSLYIKNIWFLSYKREKI